jgi:hypothetical protein
MPLSGGTAGDRVGRGAAPGASNLSPLRRTPYGRGLFLRRNPNRSLWKGGVASFGAVRHILSEAICSRAVVRLRFREPPLAAIFPAVIASYLASTGLRSKSRFTRRCGANPVGMGDILQSFFFSPAELRRLGD